MPGRSNGYFDVIFARTYQRLGRYLARHYALTGADSTALTGDVDLTAIRRMVTAALPG